MKLFSRRKIQSVSTGQISPAEKIIAGVIKIQIRIAAYLNGKTIDLSVKGKVIFLITVCLLFGSISLCLLLKAIL